MGFEFANKKWKWAAAATLSIAVAAVMAITGTISGWAGESEKVLLLIMAVMTFFACGFRVKVKNAFGLLAAFALAAFAGVFLLHMPVLGGSFMRKKAFLNEMLAAMAIVAILYAATGRIKVAGVAWPAVCLVYGVINHAVLMFRSLIITLNDFSAIDTALTVADNYTLEYHPVLLLSGYLFICVAAAFIRCRDESRRARGWKTRIAAAVLAVALLVSPYFWVNRGKPKLWGNRGAEENGVLLELFVEMQTQQQEAPEGYSLETINEILAEYPVEAAVADAGENPHIIAVMVEAFSDLSFIGDFETDEPVMPFCESFKDESIHGYAYSSVYGGKTADSEWEFMTGNSMAFLPVGTIPYQQFMEEKANSIVNILKDAGYKCLAMHPYYSTGWGRNVVYEKMGFDETCFIEDLEWGGRVRKYISDDAFVDRLIETYEAHAGDDPLFLFGITMQNHGGYTDKSFEPIVRLQGLQGNHPKAEQYLSLIRLTDEALEKMVNYFRNADEKVQIIFFGDHQPMLNSDFYKELGLDSKWEKYAVPYFIWNNYEENSGEERQTTSINYLSTMLLQEAGIELPPYLSFVADMQNAVPVINGLGYMDARGVQGDPEQASGEAREWMDKYRILQYGNMFDPNVDNMLFGKVE